MKNIFIGFILIVLSLNQLSAQKRDIVEYKQNWDKQKVFWGYYLGLNMKTYKISYLTNEDTFIDVNPAVGFDIGLIGDLRLHKNVSLRLEPGISSNTKDLTFSNIEGPPKNYRQVKSTYLRVPLLLKFNTDRFNNVRPYGVAGVSYDMNFSSAEGSQDNTDGVFTTTKNNFMYEIGLGVDFYLPYFIFSPSIRGVFAINNELVRDMDGYGNVDTDSPYTGNIDYLGTRGIFLKLAFH